MDNIIINSMNAGNLELLESSINSKEFNYSIVNKLGIQQQESGELINRFKTEINNLKNDYNTTLNKVNRLGGGFEVGRIIATQMVHARNRQTNYENLLNWANDVLNQDITNNHIEDTDIQSAKNGIYQHILDSIQRDIKTIQDNAAINNNVKQERISQLNERINAINKLYTPIDIENRNDVQSAIQLQKQYNEVFKDLAEVVNAEINVEVNKNQLNLSDDNIKSRITYLNNFFDNSRKKIVNKAMDDLRNAYKQYGKDYVNSVIKDKENGNNPNVDKTIRDAYAALDLTSKGNEHLRNTINQLAEIAEIENDVNNETKQEVAPVNPDINESNNNDDTDAESTPPSTGGIEERSEAIPSESVIPEQPQIETEQAQPQEPISTPKPEVNNILPDDEFERGQIGTDLVYEAITDLEDSLGHESTSSDLLNARQSIIDKLTATGFEQTEATEIVNNTIDGLTGGSLYSSVQDDSTRHLLLNATYATITGNNKNIEAVMDDFANSIDSEGNTRGKIVNGKVYLSIGQLVEYIDSITGNKIIKNYLFNQIKNYLYNSTNNQGKYRATDESTIKKLNARQFVQYVDNIAKERLERLQTENTNNVNLGYIVDSENVKAFTSIKQGDYLDAEYDNKTKRINILTNGTIVGYIGVPNIDKFGNYDMVNQGWKYNIHTENGQVVSPLKDALISILDGDRFDEEFIGHLYELAVKEEVTNKELDTLFKEFEVKYPDIVKNFTTPVASFDLAGHLVNLTKYIFNQPYENSHEASINRWFNNLLNSYDQAITIVKGDFKGKIKAVNIKYGVLNTIDDTNGEWNDVQETVVSYDENINKLGVVVQGQVYLNGESKPTIIENLTTNGMPVISIPSSDGTSLYAFCKQVPLNSNLLKGDARRIINSIKNEVNNLCRDYISGKISFGELKQNLGDIFGNNKLINGDRNTGLQISINPTNIGFYVKGAHFNGKDYAFTINSDAGNYKRNIIINSPYIVNSAFKIGKSYGINASTIDELDNALRPIIDEMFNYAQFAISKDFINDSTKTNDKTNKYIYREMVKLL